MSKDVIDFRDLRLKTDVQRLLTLTSRQKMTKHSKCEILNIRFNERTIFDSMVRI